MSEEILGESETKSEVRVSELSHADVQGAYPLQTLERRQTRLDASIDSAVLWLSENQHAEGYWVGMLESNCCMEAEWVLAMHFLGVEDDPKYQKVLKCILNKQRSDGSWEVYYGASGGDINTTVECYVALRVAGYDKDCDALKKARAWILRHGGLKEVRNFTKYWLALIGEWPWEHTPTLPPELIYLPPSMPFNIYQFASWARGTIIPLAILSARRAVVPLPKDKKLDELFPNGRDEFDFSLPDTEKIFSWASLFHGADWFLNRYVNFPIKPGRETAIRLCLEWVIKHQEEDGAWSGIQPPWIYSLMALKTEGYPLIHPVIKAGLDAFNQHWSYERNGGIHLQASESVVWDTTLSMLAMLDCGQNLDNNHMLSQAMDWVLGEQVRMRGDWDVYVPEAPAGGWAFERANDFYPDVDDTAVAVIVLTRLRKHTAKAPEELDQAIDVAVRWMECMQSKCGGWAAFDKDNTHKVLTKIPFADFGELLDPPSVDVTAHVLEALGLLGRGLEDPIVAKAYEYLLDEQEDDGSWFGRWGVNHIYGTAAVLPALEAIGEDMTKDYVLKAADWIVDHQNKDGGWGETPGSYMDDSLRGIGNSTASQTGWALMALLAVQGNQYDEIILRGLSYLLKHQIHGTWEEPEFTGTGFPGYAVGERIDLKKAGDLHQGTELQRAFMINYNMYRHYFPMMALGRARQHFAKYLNYSKYLSS
ncbi:MAG: squalene--hopene cyclase [Verrucomicrobiota bacterium]